MVRNSAKGRQDLRNDAKGRLPGKVNRQDVTGFKVGNTSNAHDQPTQLGDMFDLPTSSLKDSLSHILITQAICSSRIYGPAPETHLDPYVTILLRKYFHLIFGRSALA